MSIGSLYNKVQLLVWLTMLGAFLVLNFVDEGSHPIRITELLLFLKVIQASQGFDLVLNLMGVSSGSFFSSFIQYFGRMVTLFVYMHPETCFCSLRNVIIPWSLAEIIRFTYYLNRENTLATFFRYNAFLVLYPMGITGEIRCIQDWLSWANPTDNQFYLSYLYQGVLVVGLIYMYSYMLKNRARQGKLKHVDQASSPRTRKNKRE